MVDERHGLVTTNWISNWNFDAGCGVIGDEGSNRGSTFPQCPEPALTRGKRMGVTGLSGTCGGHQILLSASFL